MLLGQIDVPDNLRAGHLVQLQSGSADKSACCLEIQFRHDDPSSAPLDFSTYLPPSNTCRQVLSWNSQLTFPTNRGPEMTATKGRNCSIANALEVVGEKWSLLVLREIVLGQRRFDEIAAGTGASRDILAARLRTLVDADVLTKRRYEDHPPALRIRRHRIREGALSHSDGAHGMGGRLCDDGSTANRRRTPLR